MGSFTFERQQALLVVLARVFAQVNYFGGREPLNGELEDVVEQRVDRQRAFSDPLLVLDDARDSSRVSRLHQGSLASLAHLVTNSSASKLLAASSKLGSMTQNPTPNE